jgi:hypothetical protein
MASAPIWFNPGTLANLHVYLDALEKDIGPHAKEKYLVPFNVIKENIAALEKINEVVQANGGPTIKNADGTPKIDANINLQLITELNDESVFKIVDNIKNATQQILDVSKKEFTTKNEKGIRLAGLMEATQQLKTAHTNEKIKRELAFFGDQLKTTMLEQLKREAAATGDQSMLNDRVLISMEASKGLTWFNENNIAKLAEAAAVLKNNLPNDKKIMALPEVENKLADIEVKEMADKHLRPEIAEPAFDKNPVLNAVNIVLASIQQLRNINAKVAELGHSSIALKNGKVELQFSDHRLEDTTITNIRGNMHQAFKMIEEHLGKDSPEMAALNILKQAEPFKEHRKMKNFAELFIYKGDYKLLHPELNQAPPAPIPTSPETKTQDNIVTPPPETKIDEKKVTEPEIKIVSHPVQKPVPDPDSLVKTFDIKPEPLENLSILTPDSPVVTSSRDPGFFEETKLAAIKTILEKNGCTMSETKVIDNEAIREVTTTHDKTFTLSNKEMKTRDSDLETFKTMLQCFEATHSKLPHITTANQNLKEKWIAACKEVFPEKKIDFDSMISIKKSPTLEAPKPESTPDEPSTNARMRR